MNAPYPVKLITIGDHLRKVRLDRGMSQSQVARLLNVQADTVTGWELNRHTPTAKRANRIINFIGYLPFTIRNVPIGNLLLDKRLTMGHTRCEAAARIGCDPSTVKNIEHGSRQPTNTTTKRIIKYASILNKSCKPTI
jgi:transcriptional regulator with XRE-family HTH domain